MFFLTRRAHFRRVKNLVQNGTTRQKCTEHVAEICYYISNFLLVEHYIYDPSARIIKTPLNSTTFWMRRLTCNSATRRLRSVTRPLNSATHQILHNSIFQRSVISTWRPVH